jgi:Xaa-Pro aminopeptidase
MENYLDVLLEGQIPRELSFPADEYSNRIKRVRQEMADNDIEVLLVHSAVDLCYLTGYQTLWPDAYACLILPLEAEPFMQVGEVEASCAVLHGEITDFELLDWVGADTAPTQLATMLANRGFSKNRIGVQSGRLELGNRGPVDARLLDTLRAKLGRAKFIDATLLMFGIRLTKSPLELNYLRTSAKMTMAGINAAITEIEPGKTENDIAAVAAKTMIEQGSEFFSIDPIVNVAHRTGYFHTTFKRHPISAGDPIQLEFGACYHRYTAPVMRTVLTAEPTNLQKRMIEVQMATLETLYSSVRAGRTTKDVADEAMAVIGPLKDEIFRSGHFGYSVGLGFPPTWTDGPAYLSGTKEFELKSGMTFHTPNAWRVPKEFVIGTSETIVVTDTGCEILTSQERGVLVKK